jgi:hypothetical protein
MGTAIIDARGPLVSFSTLTLPTSAIVYGCIAYYKLDSNGFGGVSLVDSSENGNSLTNNEGVELGSGIINGGALGNGTGYLTLNSTLDLSANFAVNLWVLNLPFDYVQMFSGVNLSGLGVYANNYELGVGKTGVYNIFFNSVAFIAGWNMVSVSRQNGLFSIYLNGLLLTTALDYSNFAGNYALFAQYEGAFVETSVGVGIDEVGVWSRSLSSAEISALYNTGAGRSYPFTN